MKRIPLACVVLLFAAALIAGPAGCLRQPATALRWSDFLPELTDLQRLARLDAPPSEIITSYDRKGGNDDYNNFVRKGPKGWVVLADLRGPGVLTRFWFTGADNGSQRVRFYFDGAWRPSLELTLDELTGGREPFVAPLAASENYCWYSMVPMPFRKRLVIMTQEGGHREGGWPRLFYQVNHTPLPRETRVESFKGEVTDADRAKLDAMKSAWENIGAQPAPEGTRQAVGILALQPGERRWVDPIPGPGVIETLRVTPRFDKLPSALSRESVLRDVVLRIRWNKSDVDSVAVPLGDFFGSVWRRTRYQSLFFGLSGNTFVSRFPMPFRDEAEITIENEGIVPVEIEVEAAWRPLKAWDDNLGYFHATWSGSTPEDVGRPHQILRTQGRGKFVGCLLGVVTLDRTWWILEGDEKMYVDGQDFPQWHGTGLEDYFNGGWYYQNPLARPLHGMVFKAFFRIVQYRLHLADAVSFNTSFGMIFERGPDHASRGWMESVAYYYMDKPVATAFPLKPVGKRQPPRDPLAEATVMTELINAERMGDYRGAQDYIGQYLELYPGSPYAAVLRLRQIAYTETLEGFDTAWPLYQKFLATETNEAALAQAKLLSWFHEDEENAMVSLYSSGRSALVIDGSVAGSVDRPDRAFVAGVKIKPGRHCFAVQSTWQPYPNWVQAVVKTHKGVAGTSPEWKYAFNPSGNWGSVGFDDLAWKPVGGTGVKGPPEEPYIWLEPNAFVGLQSAAVGLRAPDSEWPGRQGMVVFRREFEVR